MVRLLGLLLGVVGFVFKFGSNWSTFDVSTSILVSGGGVVSVRETWCRVRHPCRLRYFCLTRALGGLGPMRLSTVRALGDYILAPYEVPDNSGNWRLLGYRRTPSTACSL